MMDYTNIYERLESSQLSPWVDSLKNRTDAAFASNRWGDLPKWMDAVRKLPVVTPSKVDLNAECILVGSADDCDEDTQKVMEEELRILHPWRKGPFDIFGIHIETEWRSDLKWKRLDANIESLKDRAVLDVGCGSGYHCWRMAGQEASVICGIDPTMLYVVQYQAMQKYVNRPEVSVFPIGIDDMPEDFPFFDTVFSMGLLYHRRSPLDHLLHLHSLLREDGQLVLETLVIDGQKGEILNPEGRYAKMPNVWFIPSTSTLEVWLKRTGYKDIQLIDVTKTTSAEQRATEWMGFESLADFLDPNDPDRTVEGYPAPQRAIFLAKK